MQSANSQTIMQRPVKHSTSQSEEQLHDGVPQVPPDVVESVVAVPAGSKPMRPQPSNASARNAR